MLIYVGVCASRQEMSKLGFFKYRYDTGMYVLLSPALLFSCLMLDVGCSASEDGLCLLLLLSQHGEGEGIDKKVA
jgi:hypothetical protein